MVFVSVSRNVVGDILMKHIKNVVFPRSKTLKYILVHLSLLQHTCPFTQLPTEFVLMQQAT